MNKQKTLKGNVAEIHFIDSLEPLVKIKVKCGHKFYLGPLPKGKEVDLGDTVRFDAVVNRGTFNRAKNFEVNPTLMTARIMLSKTNIMLNKTNSEPKSTKKRRKRRRKKSPSVALEHITKSNDLDDYLTPSELCFELQQKTGLKFTPQQLGRTLLKYGLKRHTKYVEAEKKKIKGYLAKITV